MPKQILKLTSPIPPSVNHYIGYRILTVNGRQTISVYKKPAGKIYEKEFINLIHTQVRKQDWKISDNKFQHYYMDCDFYFPRTDMDANNYMKCLPDAITRSEVIWLDDRQLCERVNKVNYDKENPRIEITIQPVDYIGIFENENILNEFENICIDCKRYLGGKCSLLKDSKCGIVHKEIKDNICSQKKIKKT